MCVMQRPRSLNKNWYVPNSRAQSGRRRHQICSNVRRRHRIQGIHQILLGRGLHFFKNYRSLKMFFYQFSKRSSPVSSQYGAEASRGRSGVITSGPSIQTNPLLFEVLGLYGRLYFVRIAKFFLVCISWTFTSRRINFFTRKCIRGTEKKQHAFFKSFFILKPILKILDQMGERRKGKGGVNIIPVESSAALFGPYIGSLHPIGIE